MKGVTLVPGQVVTLKLDGTLVYVESVESTFAAVVPLPEQDASREDERVFTPGRVGAKKISPFSEGTPVTTDLSDRNKKFIAEYEGLRVLHGPNYVDRTPEELAAFEAANAPKQPKAVKVKLTDEEKAAKKKKAGPRYLQRCGKCGEQQGHPSHPSDHDFVAPAILCAACDKAENDAAHGEGGHRFIATTAVKIPRVKTDKPDKPAKPARESKPSKTGVAPDQKYKWVENATSLRILIAANGKFDAKNSGGAIIETIKAAGDTGASVLDVVIIHPRPLDRLQLALGQLLGAGLLEAV